MRQHQQQQPQRVPKSGAGAYDEQQQHAPRRVPLHGPTGGVGRWGQRQGRPPPLVVQRKVLIVDAQTLVR